MQTAVDIAGKLEGRTGCSLCRPYIHRWLACREVDSWVEMFYPLSGGVEFEPCADPVERVRDRLCKECRAEVFPTKSLALPWTIESGFSNRRDVDHSPLLSGLMRANSDHYGRDRAEQLYLVQLTERTWPCLTNARVYEDSITPYGGMRTMYCKADFTCGSCGHQAAYAFMDATPDRVQCEQCQAPQRRRPTSSHEVRIAGGRSILYKDGAF